MVRKQSEDVAVSGTDNVGVRIGRVGCDRRDLPRVKVGDDAPATPAVGRLSELVNKVKLVSLHAVRLRVEPDNCLVADVHGVPPRSAISREPHPVVLIPDENRIWALGAQRDTVALNRLQAVRASVEIVPGALAIVSG